MREWRKYEKTFRLAVPEIPCVGKLMLDSQSAKAIFSGKTTITEKMDGANTGIYLQKSQYFLQKRGGWMDESHEQFKYFKNRWRWENLDKIQRLPDDVVVYGELMYCTHSIYYDSLPDFFLVFDIYDLKAGRYLDWAKVSAIARDAGLYTVPLVGQFENLKLADVARLIPDRSAFGDVAEGIVIHNYARQLRAKVVKPEFQKALDESDHWANKEVRYNKLCVRP